jgi:hypothetical protein
LSRDESIPSTEAFNYIQSRRVGILHAPFLPQQSRQLPDPRRILLPPGELTEFFPLCYKTKG